LTGAGGSLPALVSPVAHQAAGGGIMNRVVTVASALWRPLVAALAWKE